MSDNNVTPPVSPQQPEQPGFAAQPGYSAQQSAYPAQQPAYPAHPGSAPQPQQYAAQQPGYPAPQQGYGQPVAPRTNMMAILALVFGILMAPVGVILGHIALKQLKTSGEGGAGFAKAGLIIGYVMIGLWLLSMVMIVILGIIAGASSSYSY
ncbi:DUF4190 domain-containing protein [Mycetocola tolaasinivorans]|uniref:DUF4190 domain-containing protein n=1 Tax=Mycetocola tolaasinivorans TaxID=76635 RepID=A0A3L7ABT4_9MICO|nr:DUF4190 domain-containing protein [Mycetocola tolaasinivorans]RLP77260.1 DUF4190 domain-containing protein [Mycetocola tolaasinivorans]